LCRYLDAAEYLGNRFEKRIAKCPQAEPEYFSQALQLDDVGLKTWHNTPDVVKTETSEIHSTKDRGWNAQNGRYDSVAPVLCVDEGLETSAPNAINTVRSFRFRKYILKKYLEDKNK